MSGWYPDPTGRFEYRYHNDQVWTGDVASGGRQQVDPVPLSIVPPAASGNGLAVAGMVCGIVAVVIAWVPFVAVLGLITAVVGLALSIPALVRSRQAGRRGFAIAGIVTSACGLAAAVVGIVLTVALVRAVERFDDPGPHDARLTECSTTESGDLVVRGEIDNLGQDTQTYSVLVRLAPGVRQSVLIEDVPAGATVEFAAQEAGAGSTTSDDGCRIVSVNGPLPFGLDAELFE